MRCPQCGSDAAPQAVFCSRCGARLYEPKPAAVHEYSIALIRRSWWCFIRQLAAGTVAVAGGVYLVLKGPNTGAIGLAAMLLGLFIWALVPLAYRSVSWRITSDRLIEQRGILATARREVELQDIRSIEVTRRLSQRIAAIGDVLVSSAASADFLIRMSDVYDPEGVAEAVRKARLKRLA